MVCSIFVVAILICDDLTSILLTLIVQINKLIQSLAVIITMKKKRIIIITSDSK